MNAFDRAAVVAAKAAIREMSAAVNLLDQDQDSQREAGDKRWLEMCRKLDPAQVIRQLRVENLNGFAKEVSDELDRRRPRSEGGSAWIPWETLAYRSARARMSQTRADIVGSSSSGGYLVETMNFPTAASALMSMLVLGRLGATAVDATGPNLTLPKVTGSVSPIWLTAETTQVTESDQSFGQLALDPHTIGGYTEMSHLLTLQSRPDAGDVVALDLSRKIARVIEAAAFAGTGSAGQPHGIIGTTGVGAVSGASYALSTGMGVITGTGDALTDDANPGWVTNRSVASLLRQRQEFTGSPLTLWRGPLTWGQLHDFKAAGTSGVASGTALFGNWYFLILASWAGGLEISVNPFANFQQGIIGMRALATIDIGTVWPAAFAAVTGIT